MNPHTLEVDTCEIQHTVSFHCCLAPPSPPHGDFSFQIDVHSVYLRWMDIMVTLFITPFRESQDSDTPDTISSISARAAMYKDTLYRIHLSVSLNYITLLMSPEALNLSLGDGVRHTMLYWTYSACFDSVFFLLFCPSFSYARMQVCMYLQLVV